MLGDTVFINAKLATMASGGPAYGLIDDGALAISGGYIAWVGARADLPKAYASWPQEDLSGRLITPALIDCHTHIIHGGDRAREFEMRLGGATYEDIARAGGGIVSTVKHTRAATQAQLVASALPRIDHLIAEGVSVLEIKSGYGLDVETELKMLRAAKHIETIRPLRIRATYLAAHALPPEYKSRADAYIDEVCIPGLSAAQAEGLVDAVDGFCEAIGFSPVQIERVFKAAKALGIPVKLHAEQLSDLGGAKLAARYGALSADHLEHLDQSGVEAMAASGTVAVMLPGAFYALNETQSPPVKALRAAGVPLAVATDCNPGTSPMSSLMLAMNMACTLFKMTPEEALAGVTRNGARALGLTDCGVLKKGYRADLAIWDVSAPAELSYRIGFNPLHTRIFEGSS